MKMNLLLLLALMMLTADAQAQRPVVSDSLLYASLIQTYENGQHQMDQGNLVAAALAFDEVRRGAEAGGERALAQEAADALNRCHNRFEAALLPALEELLADDADGSTTMELPQSKGCVEDAEEGSVTCKATFKGKTYWCDWSISGESSCGWDQ